MAVIKMNLYIGLNKRKAQSAGAVEYIDCILTLAIYDTMI